MLGIIDRFEGDYVIVEFEGKNVVYFLKQDLPIGLRKGDVIKGVDGIYVFDEVETERVKKYKTLDNFEG